MDINIKKIVIYKSEKIKSLGYVDVNSVEESIEDFVDWHNKINN